jgi:hypothetical protein
VVLQLFSPISLSLYFSLSLPAYMSDTYFSYCVWSLDYKRYSL